MKPTFTAFSCHLEDVIKYSKFKVYLLFPGLFDHIPKSSSPILFVPSVALLFKSDNLGLKYKRLLHALEYASDLLMHNVCMQFNVCILLYIILKAD